MVQRELEQRTISLIHAWQPAHLWLLTTDYIESAKVLKDFKRRIGHNNARSSSNGETTTGLPTDWYDYKYGKYEAEKTGVEVRQSNKEDYTDDEGDDKEEDNKTPSKPPNLHFSTVQSNLMMSPSLVWQRKKRRQSWDSDQGGSLPFKVCQIRDH